MLTSLTGRVENKVDGTWLTLDKGQRYAGIVGQSEFDNSKFERFEVHIANREVEQKNVVLMHCQLSNYFQSIILIIKPSYIGDLLFHYRF
ncbi:hypothetical protein ACLKMH_23550 [Psychromonas sp. KJ10-10]|uniref:hypothetical protein n=1 Tax=Psychromonas sp. KJ10-10 TaxID=3391823 RepID=UPI0039B57E7C